MLRALRLRAEVLPSIRRERECAAGVEAFGACYLSLTLMVALPEAQELFARVRRIVMG